MPEAARTVAHAWTCSPDSSGRRGSSSPPNPLELQSAPDLFPQQAGAASRAPASRAGELLKRDPDRTAAGGLSWSQWAAYGGLH